jgi:hypothetical protein
MMGSPEENRPLGKPRSRWMNNNKMDFGDITLVVRTGVMWLRIGTSGGLS